MNVVPRDKLVKLKSKPKLRNELVRKDSTLGVRGTTSILPRASTSNAPRYKFDEGGPSAPKKFAMGPPLGPPRSAKRKSTQTSRSTRLESSSSSGRVQPGILASDSAVPDTFCTPKNRNTALRYISSSSRGGYSGRSARSTSTSAVDASVILAISEGRGMARGEIGIAAVDLRHPHLVLCQFSDSLFYTHTLTKINLYNPVEIIFPHTFCEGVQPSQLYQLIRNQFPLVNLTTVQRRHFNDAAGRQQIQTLCAPQYSAVCLQVLQKFYALTAAAAVLKYVEYIQCIVFARESLKIEYHSSENTMIIDVGTATQLELVQPLVPAAGSTCCLLGILGPTYTIGGIRALRAAILQPSCNRVYIENRQDAVQDLIDNDSGLMTSLQDVIKKLSEIDKILFLCVESPNQGTEKQGEAQLNQTILLKTTMDMVPKIVEALSTAQSGRLRKIKMDFENPHYKEIADRIRVIIQEDAHLEKGAMGSLQRCFAVKPNINGLLDVGRRTYSELIEDIQKIVEQLGETYDLPLRLNNNVMKGFHIVMSIAPKNRRSFNEEDLPPIFIQVQYNGVSVTMTTEELVVLDQQAKESLNEIQKMSNIVISEMLKELRPFMSSLYKLCENVAELDILLALAQCSTIGSYIRPEFGSYLDIRNSVHPLLDYNSEVTPIANDIYATPEYNFTIITGPNMGGKSIYIKQIALMQIMAQIGCFIPATSAVLRLCDRIFSRIGFNDSVELNASTYVIEMKEMQHIMTGLTSSSVVIIDELCRGTCTEEGTSIAWAICEDLLISEAFIFFTTHFMYLTRLQDLYFNVVNRHMAVTEELIESSQSSDNPQKRLVYQHKLENGATKIEHYGIALASKTHLPEETVKLAKEFVELIDKESSPQEITTPERKDDQLLYKLNADIRQESRKHVDAKESIKKIFQKFKEDHPQLVERLKCQRSTRHNRTDSSANYSSLSKSRPSFAENLSRQSLQPIMPKIIEAMREDHRPKIICSASDDVENVQSVDSYDNENNLRRQFSNKIQSQASQKFKNPLLNKTHLKPTVIYSTSEDDIHTNDSRKLTSVKSSNELLTSVMNIDNDKSIEETHNPSGHGTPHMRQCNNDSVTDRQTSSSEDVEDNTVEDACEANIELDSDVAHNVDASKDGNESSSVVMDEPNADINNSTKNDSNLSQSQNDSDIADALTQIIEDLSIEIDSSDDSGTCSRMSVNEELMMETINEINEELQTGYISIENIVLTPPIEFRD